MNEAEGLEKNIRALGLSARQLSMRAKRIQNKPDNRLEYVQTCLAIKVLKDRIAKLNTRLKELGGACATVQD